MADFASRAGQKLDHALTAFKVDVLRKNCADLGCSTGGFVDCLLQRGAAKVFAIDTGYGVLDWKLRNDPRVIVMERTNALHADLPEKVDFISIDVGWTRQRLILPAARRMLADGGRVVSLIKPQYEADRATLRQGVMPEELVDGVVEQVVKEIATVGFAVEQIVRSPITGAGGNVEVLALLCPSRN